MHQETLKEIVAELNAVLPGRFLGKIFQLSAVAFAIDFGLKTDYLFTAVEPGAPRLYLIKRKSRDLQSIAVAHSPFAQAIRASLAGGKLLHVTNDAGERVVRFSLLMTDERGDIQERLLVAQLTGRSANLLLIDSSGVITHVLRPTKGTGQRVGDQYRPPMQSKVRVEETRIGRENFPTLSAAADKHYLQLGSQQALEALSKTLVSKLKKEVQKRNRLKTNLNRDLVAHGNPAEHKRLGDLLLANIANVERAGDKVRLTDYYADGAPTIEIELDPKKSLQEAASDSFSRYAKSKRAVQEIGTRLDQIERELTELAEKECQLQEAIASGGLVALREFDELNTGTRGKSKKRKARVTLPGMRHYRSSDGYEVLVGRTARDNDTLTFRVARPNDLWFHAGDYPGSHVIVRNSSRKEVPHRTVIEAAQLAAKFSQAGKDSKVTVHYTPRKFLAKPKGAAPGLVRMSSFRSISVEPREAIERL